MTQPAHSPRARRDRGASAVEYGLLVAGITVTFLLAAIGLQGAVGAVLGNAVNSVQHNDTPVPAAVPAPPAH